MPGLQVFESSFGAKEQWGHLILIVAPSGRVQLRLDYRVPYELRAREAARVWNVLRAWLREEEPPETNGSAS